MEKEEAGLGEELNLGAGVKEGVVVAGGLGGTIRGRLRLVPFGLLVPDPPAFPLLLHPLLNLLELNLILLNLLLMLLLLLPGPKLLNDVILGAYALPPELLNHPEDLLLALPHKAVLHGIHGHHARIADYLNEGLVQVVQVV